MLIIGCDYHPSVQQIAFVDLETGETGERQLLHKDGEAERFYRGLKLRGISVRVGIEATGHARWFERLLAELGFELWIGDPAQIKAARVRKQKTDRQDARRSYTKWEYFFAQGERLDEDRQSAKDLYVYFASLSSSVPMRSSKSPKGPNASAA